MLKFLYEIIPVIAFLLGYKAGGIQVATLWTLIASIVSIVIYYALYRKLQNIALISSGILVISSSMTLLTGNAIFIKMKPTIIYIVFSVACLWSSWKDSPIIKYMLGGTLTLKNDDGWKTLSNRFAVFFFVMAIVNEIVWRHFAEVTWVKFKVFGALPLILIFIALQIPFLLRNQADEK